MRTGTWALWVSRVVPGLAAALATLALLAGLVLVVTAAALL